MKLSGFLIAAAIVTAGMCMSCSQTASQTACLSKSGLADWIFYFSDKKIGAIQPDGGGEQYFYFPEKNQRCWQGGGLVMPDRRRIIFWSQEPPIDPKASFYDKKGLRFAESHLWYYDFTAKNLQQMPIAGGIVAIMPDGKRFIVADDLDENKSKTGVYTVNLDGSDKRNVHDLGGYSYGISLSPDGKSIAYHNASEGYKIYAFNLETGQKTLLAEGPEYLNFGSEWSPDGQWVLFQRCLHKDDPMHNRSDLCIVRADGSELRVLTTGQRHWFGTSYGPADNHGGGSNRPTWSPDGKWITFTRCSEGAQTAWMYRKDRPDTDHFNCDYMPEQAQGGSQICLVDVKTGEIKEVTPFQEKMWAWRTCWSPDSKQIVYARAAVGEQAQLWIINADGSNPRRLTAGFESQGADFPYWMRLNSQPK
jgi:Tol biopolymer transport system component